MPPQNDPKTIKKTTRTINKKMIEKRAQNEKKPDPAVNGKRRISTLSLSLLFALRVLRTFQTKSLSTDFCYCCLLVGALGLLLAGLGPLLATFWSLLATLWPLLAALGRSWPVFGRS